MNRRDFLVATVALVAAWLTGQRMQWRRIFAPQPFVVTIAPPYGIVQRYGVSVERYNMSLGLLDCTHSTLLQALPPEAYAAWRRA